MGFQAVPHVACWRKASRRARFRAHVIKGLRQIFEGGLHGRYREGFKGTTGREFGEQSARVMDVSSCGGGTRWRRAQQESVARVWNLYSVKPSLTPERVHKNGRKGAILASMR